MRNKFICHLTALLCALALLPALAPPALAADAFRDVPPTQWAYQAIMDAAGRGIAAGYQDGTFHPEGQVTYAQFSAFLARSTPPAAHGTRRTSIPSGQTASSPAPPPRKGTPVWTSQSTAMICPR